MSHIPTIRALLALFLLILLSAPALAEEPFETLAESTVRDAQALQKTALESSMAWDFLEDLTVEVGPRFPGSEGDRRGVAWALARLEEMGFENVRAEPVEVPHWVRGHADGQIVDPYPQRVVLAALGGSVGTRDEGIEAEVFEVPTLADLVALEGEAAAAVEGKIVFINHRMRRDPHGAGYGETVGGRRNGAIEAAKRGAVALLIRSIGTDDDRIAHTGGMRYADDVRRIPAAALSNPDADLLALALDRSPVRFRLTLGARELPPAMSANVIGEIRGSEAPEEIVLLAAHLDSWDLGTGAVDDGSGCAIVSAAARLVADLERPRRTLRVLLAANEEFGLSGARAYAQRYADEVDNHVLAFEADFGAGRVIVFRGAAGEDAAPFMRDLGRLLAPLGITHVENQLASGGADLIPLRPARVPMLDLFQDGTDYFDIHHTENDTLDEVDPEDLAQNVAAYATAALAASRWPGDFGRAPAPE